MRNWVGGGAAGSYWLGLFSRWTAPLNGSGSFFTRLREVAVVRRLAVRAPMPFVRVVRETKRAMSETKCVAGVIKPIV